MTLEQINELIPRVHEHYKEKGAWGGVVDVSCKTGCTDAERDNDGRCLDYESRPPVCYKAKRKNNAFIASKLDDITITAAKAMEAKREGRRSVTTAQYLVVTKDITYSKRAHYNAFVRGTFEDLLAHVALLTMDLMGFYGVEYIDDWSDHRQDPTVFLLLTIKHLAHLSLSLRCDGKSLSDNLSIILHNITRVAELEQIDLEWHIEARMKYERDK